MENITKPKNITQTVRHADHRKVALDYVDAVKTTARALEGIYGQPEDARAKIAQAHQDIGVALKLAHVHAVLEVAAAIREARP